MAESSKGSGLSYGPDPYAAFQGFAQELMQVRDSLEQEHHEKAKSSKPLFKVKHINFHLRAALLKTLHLSKMPSVGEGSGLRKNLLQHQKDGVGRMKQWQDNVNSRGGILADDMGMGKTVQAIAFLVERPPTPKHPAIIAVPPALMSNWMKEFEKWSYPSQLNVLYVHNSIEKTTKREKLNPNILQAYNVIVISHHQVTHEFKSLHAKNFASAPPLLALGSRVPSVFIVDEAHHAFNYTQLGNALDCASPKMWIFLTGSPFQNYTRELGTVVRLLKIQPWDNMANFRRAFMRDATSSTPRQQRRLNYVLAPYIIRRFKEENLDLFPPKKIIEVQHDVGEMERQVLDGEKNCFDGVRGFTIGAVGTGAQESLRQRQLVCHPALALRKGVDADIPLNAIDWVRVLEGLSKNWVPSARIEAVYTAHEEYHHGTENKDDDWTKTIVFSSWSRLLDLLVIHLEKATPVASSLIFRIDERVGKVRAILLAKTGSLAEGFNILSATSIIFGNLGWRGTNEEQAQDRCHRIGQERPIVVYYLSTPSIKIEKRLLKLRRSKKNHARNIVDSVWKHDEEDTVVDGVMWPLFDDDKKLNFKWDRTEAELSLDDLEDYAENMIPQLVELESDDDEDPKDQNDEKGQKDQEDKEVEEGQEVEEDREVQAGQEVEEVQEVQEDDEDVDMDDA